MFSQESIYESKSENEPFARRYSFAQFSSYNYYYYNTLMTCRRKEKLCQDIAEIQKLGQKGRS